MIGRLARMILSGLCAAFLWFHARRVYRDSADVTVGRTYVWATSDREGVSVWVIRGWLWPQPLRVRSEADADRVEYYSPAIRTARRRA